MSKKEKVLIIALFVTFSVIIVALSITFVLVSRIVTVGTAMNITFTSKEIACIITGSAKYKYLGTEDEYTYVNVVGTSETSIMLTFKAGVEYNDVYTMAFDKIDIGENGEAVYAFSIENTGTKTICAKVSVGEVTNMVRSITAGEYYTSTEGVGGYIINAGQTRDFEIKLTVDNKGQNALAADDISMVLATEFDESNIAATVVDHDGAVIAVADNTSNTIQLPANTKTTSIDDNGTTKYFQGYLKTTTTAINSNDYNNNYSDYKYTAITTLPSNLILPFQEVTISAGDIFTSYYDVDPSEISNYTFQNNATNNGWSITGYSGFDTELILPTLYQGKLVTGIGKSAFRGCTSLTNITIPSSLTSIDYNAFSGCTSLTGVYISDLSKWCNISFGNYAANPLYYAHNLYIDGVLLTTLTIPSDITEIKDYAFNYCTSLISIEIPNSVTSIDGWAFDGCSGLTSITIPSSVTSIGESAFYGCTSLTSISIPSSVTSIGSYAFYGCSSLNDVAFSDTASKWSVTSGSTTVELSVGNSGTNATNLKSTYSDYTWTKKQ